MTTGRAALALWLLVMAAALHSARQVAGDDLDSPWGALEIPGGFAALQDVVHLAAPADEWRTLPLVIELSFAGAEGLRYTRLINAYASDLRRSRATTVTLAPLPLGSAFWEARFDPAPPPHDLLWAILASREMSALYYGLLGLDDSTLRAINGDPALTKALVRYALALPTAAPALRIEQGRVWTPGGEAAAPLWESLVGERRDRPAQFVGRLLGRDGGRLAHFFSTVASLPVETVRFFIGASSDGHRARPDALARLYGAFQPALGDWRADALRLPSAGGPARVLASITVGPDGELAGAPWESFWHRALESDAWPTDPSRALGSLDPNRRIDAAHLLQLLCPSECDERRLAAVLLLQREFPRPDVDLAPALLAVVRARLRYPALALEIERLALADAAAYAELGGVAWKIERLDQPARAVALVQFQAAVALLARLRAVGAPAAMVRAHVGTLASLPLTSNGFEGSLLRWLGDVFGSANGSDLDDLIERSAAGSPWLTADARLEWEGMAYRVDIAATERVRIRAARAKFASNTLIPAAALLRFADDIPDALAAGEIEERLASMSPALGSVREPGEVLWTGARTDGQRVHAIVRQVAARLRTARPTDRRRAEQAMRVLRRTADLLAADALAGLVYAVALHNLDGAMAMSPELPRRHRLEEAAQGTDRVSAWDLPAVRQQKTGSRYISGSLLALEVGVTELGMRRMRTDRPRQEPNISPRLAAGLQRTAALASAWTIDAGALEAVEAARARGAAVAGRWTANRLDASALVPAGIAGPRAAWVRWRLLRGETVESVLSLEDLVRLGTARGHAHRTWGAAASLDQCLCLRMPQASWEVQRRAVHPERATELIVEPALRVAVELHRRALPAVLAPGVLALVTTDLIEQSALPHPLDAAGIAEALRRVPPHRFDDYVAAVAARGPLVPIDASAPRAAGRRTPR